MNEPEWLRTHGRIAIIPKIGGCEMFTNWKTTVTGIIGFILAGCTAKGWVTAEQAAAILAAIVGILGVLAKDGDVTGGTRVQ